MAQSKLKRMLAPPPPRIGLENFDVKFASKNMVFKELSTKLSDGILLIHNQSIIFSLKDSDGCPIKFSLSCKHIDKAYTMKRPRGETTAICFDLDEPAAEIFARELYECGYVELADTLPNRIAFDIIDIEDEVDKAIHATLCYMYFIRDYYLQYEKIRTPAIEYQLRQQFARYLNRYEFQALLYRTKFNAPLKFLQEDEPYEDGKATGAFENEGTKATENVKQDATIQAAMNDEDVPPPEAMEKDETMETSILAAMKNEDKQTEAMEKEDNETKEASMKDYVKTANALDKVDGETLGAFDKEDGESTVAPGIDAGELSSSMENEDNVPMKTAIKYDDETPDAFYKEDGETTEAAGIEDGELSLMVVKEDNGTMETLLKADCKTTDAFDKEGGGTTEAMEKEDNETMEAKIKDDGETPDAFDKEDGEATEATGFEDGQLSSMENKDNETMEASMKEDGKTANGDSTEATEFEDGELLDEKEDDETMEVDDDKGYESDDV